MTLDHAYFMDRAYQQALKSYNEGGCPIGALLVRNDGTILGEGHNMRVQGGNPILHGETSALQNAGRQKSYLDTVMYTSLSPCMMCTGTIIQFKIPHVVIGENINFSGNEEFLQSRGVKVTILNHKPCIDLMTKFIKERPELWFEDIAEQTDAA